MTPEREQQLARRAELQAWIKVYEAELQRMIKELHGTFSWDDVMPGTMDASQIKARRLWTKPQVKEVVIPSQQGWFSRFWADIQENGFPGFRL